ncbi:MAG: tetratricopeptide repeat protein [Ignavibacteria bacterium]
MIDKHDENNLPDFDSLWDYNHPEKTEIKFRELLPAAKKSDNLQYFLQLLTQIARTQGLQRKFDDAHKTLDEAEGLMTGEMKKEKIRYLLERGRTYNSSNFLDKAKPLFLKAWKLGLESGEDFYAIDAAHMMAIVESQDEALNWNEKALELAEKSQDDKAKKWLGALYNNIGWTYHDRGDYDKALDYFVKDFKWYSENNKHNEARIARWSIAKSMRSLNRIDEALGMQKSILKEIEENNLEPDGFVYEEVGECLLALKKATESQPYFKQAYELLSKDIWLTSNEPARIERIKKLGNLS